MIRSQDLLPADPRKLVLLFTCLIGIFLNGCGSDTFNYQVIVKDIDNGEAIENANVRLEIAAGVTPSDTTDHDGKVVFEIENAHAGKTVDHVVEAAGCKKGVFKHSLKKGGTQRVQINCGITAVPPTLDGTPALSPDKLVITNPPTEVDVVEDIVVKFYKIPKGWLVRGVTRNENGSHYVLDQGDPAIIEQEEGELLLKAHFGDRTHGIGQEFQYFVVATAPESEANAFIEGYEKAGKETFPSSSADIVYSEPIMVTRIGPTEHWYVEFFPYTPGEMDLEYGSIPTIEPLTISELFFTRDWWNNPPLNSEQALGEEIPEDNWGARFVRRIYFPESREYTFYLERDDGTRLWVDYEIVIDAWNDTNLTRESETVHLEAGFHDVEIAYYDGGGRAQVGFWIEDPGADPPRNGDAGSDWMIMHYPNLELSGDPVYVYRDDNVGLDKEWLDKNQIPLGDRSFSQYFTDYFSTQATKQAIFEAGLYQFSISGDDTVQVMLDDETVFFADQTWQSCHPDPCRVLVDIADSNGTDAHNLVVRQWQTSGGAYLGVSWEPVEITWESFTNPYTVSAMAVDKESVWAGGNGGLVRWNKNSDNHDVYLSESGLPGDGLASNVITAVLIDRDGEMWTGTGEGYGLSGSGLTRFDGEESEIFTSDNTDGGLCSNGIYYLYQDDREYPLDNSVWAGTDGGLSRYDPDTEEWECFNRDDGLGSNSVNAIVYDDQSQLWIEVGGASETEEGDRVGVNVRLEDGEWKFYEAEEMGSAALNQWGFTSALRDSNGYIWFGSYAGPTYFDGEWHVITDTEKLPSDNIQAMISDKHGNIWFGLPEGAIRYDGDSWRTFTTDDDMASDDVTSFAVDEDGVLWAGHSSNGYTDNVSLSRFDAQSEKWISYALARNTIPNEVTSIQEDQEGAIWIGTGFPPTGTGFGLRILDENTAEWKIFSGKVDYTDFIFLDEETGDLWFGTDNNFEGVTRFDGENWSEYTVSNSSLESDGVDDMIRANDGSLWFATSGGGISRLIEGENGGWINFNANTERATPSNDANVVFEDSNNILWFGFNEGGLVRYDRENEDWDVYTAELVDDSVSNIVEDDQGILWFATTGGGISLYNPEDETWSSQTESDGLLSYKVYTLFKDSSEWIWAGTKWGASVYTGERWLNFTTADGLAGRHVWTIWESEPGEMWFGTNGGISKLTFTSSS